MLKRVVFLSVVFSLFVCSRSFSQDLVWHTDIDVALEEAANNNKKLLLFFTGSNWCGWCKKLQNEVFFTSDFETWSKDVVLVELDFPRGIAQEESLRNQNQYLQSMFKVAGYPTVYFVDVEKMSDGRTNLKSLGRTGYVRGGVKKWLNVADDILKKTI